MLAFSFRLNRDNVNVTTETYLRNSFDARAVMLVGLYIVVTSGLSYTCTAVTLHVHESNYKIPNLLPILQPFVHSGFQTLHFPPILVQVTASRPE